MQKTPVKVGEYSFTIIIEPNEPDGYLVTSPALPGPVTEGDKLDYAYAMAQDGIQGYLESLIANGEPIPRDNIAMRVPVKIENDKIAAWRPGQEGDCDIGKAGFQGRSRFGQPLRNDKRQSQNSCALPQGGQDRDVESNPKSDKYIG